jgi:hypothetical protein
MFDAFQSIGDDRCGKDDYKVYNPGKSAAQKGNFGYYKGYHSDDEMSRNIESGRDVFNLPRDLVPSQEQIKEIWFTFNLLTNFFNNRNFKPGGNPLKIVKWFESIAASYLVTLRCITLARASPGRQPPRSAVSQRSSIPSSTTTGSAVSGVPGARSLRLASLRLTART